MSIHLIYRGGKFEPVGPVDLPEGSALVAQIAEFPIAESHAVSTALTDTSLGDWVRALVEELESVLPRSRASEWTFDRGEIYDRTTA